MGVFSDYYQIDSYAPDEEMVHKSVDEEIAFYRAICSGDMDAIRKNCEEKRFHDQEGVGRLSQDPVTNLKYHMVITAAMTTRLCIEKGLESERAFRMSDFYIQQLDQANTIDQVTDIHDRMVLDFTGKMRLLRKDTGTSRPITKCINYIYIHINERITIGDLSEYAKVSQSYLSRQFPKEIGVSVSDYIREKKIEIAQDLLKNTDRSIIDIACQLSFSSQSHFIQTFKHYVGITPKKYRTLNGHDTWMGKDN
ncbi:MAG: helix-turn-helix transcriptional regulator [Lachnospiraceae bacterium]|nr:helix-turn-helix transcriptional regulator [Lachnospiraceae bacterium]